MRWAVVWCLAAWFCGSAAYYESGPPYPCYDAQTSINISANGPWVTNWVYVPQNIYCVFTFFCKGACHTYLTSSATARNGFAIDFFDGNDTSAPRIGSIVGDTISPLAAPGGVVSTGHFLTLRLTSSVQFSMFHHGIFVHASEYTVPGAPVCKAISFCTDQTGAVQTIHVPWRGTPVNVSEPAACNQSANAIPGATTIGVSYHLNDDAGCAWLVQGQPGGQVTFSLTGFSLQAGDTLSIFDGSDASAPRLLYAGGYGLPAQVSAMESSGGVLFVRLDGPRGFRTGFEGFALSFMMAAPTAIEPECPASLSATASPQSFEYPQLYPYASAPLAGAHYSPSQACNVTIASAPGTTVFLSFTLLEIAASDLFEIFDGSTPATLLFASTGGAAGLDDGLELRSKSNVVQIVFRSTASSLGAGGFMFSYSSAPSMSVCATSSNLVAARGLLASATSDDTGLFDPGFTYRQTNQVCTFNIQASLGQDVTVELIHVDLLVGDFFTVTSATETIILGANNVSSVARLIQHGATTLTYRTGTLVVPSSGFAANYSVYTTTGAQCATLTPVLGPAVVAVPMIAGAALTRGLNCAFNLTAPPGQTVRLRIDPLGSDNQASDTITVYDGANTQAPLLGTASLAIGGWFGGTARGGGGLYVVLQTATGSTPSINYPQGVILTVDAVTNGAPCVGSITLSPSPCSDFTFSTLNPSATCLFNAPAVDPSLTSYNFSLVSSTLVDSMLVVYDGASTSSAVILDSSSPSPFSASAIASSGRMTIALAAAANTRGESVAFRVCQVSTPTPACATVNSVAIAANATITLAGVVSATAISYGTRYAVGSTCTRSYYALTPNSYVYLMFIALDLRPGAILFIHDGASNNSPILAQYSNVTSSSLATLPPSLRSSGRNVTLRLVGPLDATAPRGFGFAIQAQIRPEIGHCVGVKTFSTTLLNVAKVVDGLSSTNATDYVYPAGTVCTYMLSGRPGAVIQAVGHPRTDGICISIYEGASTSDALLGSSCVASTPVRVQSTGNQVFVSIMFPAKPVASFSLVWSASLAPTPCGGTQYIIAPYDTISIPSNYGGLPTATRRVTSIPAGLDCSYVIVTVPAYTARVTVSGAIGANDSLTITDNEVSVFNGSAGQWPTAGNFSVAALCGNLTLHFMSAAISSSGTGIVIDISWDFVAMSDVCLHLPMFRDFTDPTRAACIFGVYSISGPALASIYNCSILLNYLNLNAVFDYYLPNLLVIAGKLVIQNGNALRVNMPNLRMIGGDLDVSVAEDTVLRPGDADTFRMPSLIAITGTLTMKQNAFADTMFFPSLLYTGTVSLLLSLTPNLRTFSAPLLRQVDILNAQNLRYASTIVLPSLVTAKSRILLTNALALTTLQLDSLVSTPLFQLDNSPLSSLDLPSLVSVGTFSMSNNIGLQSLSSSLSQATTITLSASYTLRALSLPLFAVGALTLTNAPLETLSLPSFNSGSLAVASTSALTSLTIPAVESVTSISIAQTGLQTLSIPSSGSIGSLILNGNRFLHTLNMCGLSRLSSISVTACGALSCTDLSNLALFYNTRLNASLSTDCSATAVGTFGCQRNQTMLVNTTQCGFTVACIQLAIDATVTNQSTTVLVPAGTYRGCNTSLSAHGKVLTLAGEAAALTIIDCGGNGRGLVVDQGETRATEFRDFSIVNGSSDIGGLVLVTAGSTPTLTRLHLSMGTASTMGGGLAVTASAAPLLTDVVVSDSRAPTGAGVAVTGGMIDWRGGGMERNVASDNGGGLLVLTSPSKSFITGATIRANTAPRGAGVYAETAVRIVDSVLEMNSASDFGGGVAAVPLTDYGTCFEFRDTVIHGNTAQGGAGIFSFSGNIDAENLTLIDGVSGARGGGGLLVTCSQNYRELCGVNGPCTVYTQLRHSTVAGNRAEDGGVGGGLLVQESYLNITDSLLFNNTASTGGGAYISTAVLTARRVTWQANTAVLASGGGLYCEPRAGGCDVQACTITSNQAPISGAGIYSCFEACPNATTMSPLGGKLPDCSTGGSNVVSGNMVQAGGYGAQCATDPAKLAWVEPPKSEVKSGESVTTDGGSLVVLVFDAYNQAVTTTANILTLTLSVTFQDGTPAYRDGAVGASAVTLSGTQTTLTQSGVASFDGLLLTANNVTYLDTPYHLGCGVSELTDVLLSSTILLKACDEGEGRTDPTGAVTCLPCAVGSAGGRDTGFVCIACAAGYVASTAGSVTCSPCPPNTYAPLTGAGTCLACPAGFSAAGSASTVCVQQLADSTALTTTQEGAIIGGVIAGLLLCGCIIVYALYTCARRRTMTKYYLDNDATVRTGAAPTPLQNEVKKVLLSSSTTRIGGGLYSNVYKAKYENKWIALKVIKGEMATDGTAQQEFRREALALIRLEAASHPGIIQMAFFLAVNPMCIGVAFCHGGSLKVALANKTISSSQDKLRVITEAASAFMVMHSYNIVHMDVKTDNVLLTDDGHVVVADFGIARALGTSGDASSLKTDLPMEYAHHSSGGSSKTDSKKGSAEMLPPSRSDAQSTAFTPQYADPIRLLMEVNTNDAYLKTSDVFSFAVMMWAVYSGIEPYAGEEPEKLIERLRANVLIRPPPLSADCPPFYSNLMQRAWHEDPWSRPTFIEVFSTLAINIKPLGIELLPGYADPNPAPAAPPKQNSSRSPSVTGSQQNSAGAFGTGGDSGPPLPASNAINHLAAFDSNPPPPPPHQGAHNPSLDSMPPPPPPTTRSHDASLDSMAPPPPPGAPPPGVGQHALGVFDSMPPPPPPTAPPQHDLAAFATVAPPPPPADARGSDSSESS